MYWLCSKQVRRSHHNAVIASLAHSTRYIETFNKGIKSTLVKYCNCHLSWHRLIIIDLSIILLKSMLNVKFFLEDICYRFWIDVNTLQFVLTNKHAHTVHVFNQVR